MTRISPAGPSIDSIIAAWRNPSSAADLPADLRAQLPANPAGNVTQIQRFSDDDQNNHYTVACFSNDCFSSQCYSNVCYSADCFTGQNHCGYTTSC